MNIFLNKVKKISDIDYKKIINRSFLIKIVIAYFIAWLGFINSISIPDLILLIYGSVFILFKVNYRSVIIVITFFLFLATFFLITKNPEPAKTLILYTFYITLAITIIELKIYMVLAIFLLALSPLLLSLGFVKTSEIVAIYAFFLLMLTILIQFHKLITIDPTEKK